MEWASLSDNLPWASTAEVQAFSSNSVLMKPHHLPLFTIKNELVPSAGSSKAAKGLKVWRANWNYTTKWEFEFDPHNLSTIAGSSVDPWYSYFVIDDDGDPKRLALSELQDALGATNNYIVNSPVIWFYYDANVVGYTYGGTGMLRNNLSVKDFEGNPVSVSATDFSAENLNGVSSITFSNNLDYGLMMSGTVASGTFEDDGSIIWSCDIVYTDDDGVTGRVTVGNVNPTVDSGPGFDVPGEIFNVIVVDAWPTTQKEGFFFKMGDGLRYYYIDEGSCQWGYQTADGSSGACLETK
jgi:hypothetical protein